MTNWHTNLLSDWLPLVEAAPSELFSLENLKDHFVHILTTTHIHPLLSSYDCLSAVEAAPSELFSLENLKDHFGHEPREVEQSKDKNHFMYYTLAHR